MSRFVLAPVRNLVRVALAVVGLLLSLLAVVAATLVFAYPAAAIAIRALADLGRRLSGQWGGVTITPPPPQIIVEPHVRDGWYVYNHQLFRSRWFPASMMRIEAMGQDPRLMRDWMWLFLTPFGGAAASALPLALLGGGVALVAMGRWPWAAAATILVGLLLGPAALRVHGLWDRVLLQPAEESWWHRSGWAGWVARTSRAAWGAAGLAGIAAGGFALGLVAAVAIVVTLGWAAPVALRLVRPYVDRYRIRATRWAGADLPDPYRPLLPPPTVGPDGMYRIGRSLYNDRSAAIAAQRDWWLLRDPASWRDLTWMLTAAPMVVVSTIPAALVAVGFFGLVWQVVWWWPWAVPVGLTSGVWVTPFYMWKAVVHFIPSAAAIPEWLSVPIGLAIAAAGALLAIPLMRLRTRVDHRMLAPTRATVLAQRVHRLIETRADAVDAQAAELRRIERDLHDGAQARLVAVGLGLATVERLLETDPQAARALLAQARQSSVTALTELRALVRGIHPPVLAERGLADAVRAIALDQPVPVTVIVDLPGRLAAPVESAAYFAICEALANSVHHASATAIKVEIRHVGGGLRIIAQDNGRGGADPARGTGLIGMRKRLGTFDGTVALVSPAGGPTVLTMEIPCALL